MALVIKFRINCRWSAFECHNVCQLVILCHSLHPQTLILTSAKFKLEVCHYNLHSDQVLGYEWRHCPYLMLTEENSEHRKVAHLMSFQIWLKSLIRSWWSWIETKWSIKQSAAHSVYFVGKQFWQERTETRKISILLHRSYSSSTNALSFLRTEYNCANMYFKFVTQ